MNLFPSIKNNSQSLTTRRQCGKPSTIFYGDSLELNATIYEGYTFLHWLDSLTGDIISSQKDISISPKQTKVYKLYYEKLHYQLDVSSTDGGAVIEATNPPFYWEDEIDIVATVDNHWVFSRWTGIGSENIEDPYNPNTTLLIKKDSSLVAEFKPQEYSVSVTVTPEGFGGVSTLQKFLSLWRYF